MKIRSGGAIEVEVIVADPGPMIKGTERRVRRCCLNSCDRQQKRENENKFSHSVHSFRALVARACNFQRMVKRLLSLSGKFWGTQLKEVVQYGLGRYFDAAADKINCSAIPAKINSSL